MFTVVQVRCCLLLYVVELHSADVKLVYETALPPTFCGRQSRFSCKGIIISKMIVIN